MNRRFSAYAAACLGVLAVGGAPGGPGLLARPVQAYVAAATPATSGAGPVAPAPSASPAAPESALLSNAERLGAQVRVSGQTTDRLHRELAAADAQIEAVNREARSLDAEIAASGRRLVAEKQELRALARAIYIQPDSIVLALAESRNLGDFVTRVGDLAVAGLTARSLVRSLDADGRRLVQDRKSVQQAQAKLASLRQTVLADLDALAAEAAAANAAQTSSLVPSLPAGSGDIPAIIRAAFAPLGQPSVNWALKVAFCESGYNPNAVNPYSGTEGLFQFMPSTWAGTPWGRDSPFNPQYNALAAAWLYQRQGGSPWQCKG